MISDEGLVASLVGDNSFTCAINVNPARGPRKTCTILGYELSDPTLGAGTAIFFVQSVNPKIDAQQPKFSKIESSPRSTAINNNALCKKIPEGAVRGIIG